MLYISNAFSLNMLPLEWRQEMRALNVIIMPLSITEVREIIRSNHHVVSAVGHDSTAKLYTEVLGCEIAPNRIAIRLNIGDELIVGIVPVTRLPEGKILDDKEIQEYKEKIKWVLVKRIS